MKYIVTILMLLFSSFLPAAAQKPAAIVPEFTFYKVDKTSFTNAQLPGSKMLFFVFFDITCEHCQQAIQYINRHHKAFEKVAVYLITLDEWDKVKLFINRYGPQLENKTNIKILRDTRNEFITKFGPVKYPSLFLYSAKRQLILYDDEENSLERFKEKINSKVN